MKIFFYALFLTISYAQTLPGLKLAYPFDTKIFEISNFNDWLWSNFYVGIMHSFIFFGIGAALEFTNDIPKTPERKKSNWKQIIYGIQALLWIILFTTWYMWKIEPLTPYYGYYAQNEFTIKEFIISLVIYALVFDIWFYVTHIILHIPFFWKYIHQYHHQFREPSAFAQDAVHPIEALIQGSLSFKKINIQRSTWPFNPLTLLPNASNLGEVYKLITIISIFGLLTGIYAQFAHDARWDPIGHINHHFYVECNYGIWGSLDYLFGTKYHKDKFPLYVPSWKRGKQEIDKSLKED